MIDHVVRGTTNTFYARVYDYDNTLLDPDLIEVFVIAPGDAYPGEGSQSVIKVSTGVYSADITIPASAELGTWGLYWSITIAGEHYYETEEFEVDPSVDLFFDHEVLMVNQKYTVTVDSSVKDVDGNSLLADSDISFYTELEPMYATVQDVRLLVGTEISGIPDSTIALRLWKASIHADAITYQIPPASGGIYDHYVYARENFVLYQSMSDLLNLLEYGIGGGYKKVLGDLEISRFGNKPSDDDLLHNYMKQARGWEWVVKTGGRMAPDSALRPLTANKGAWHPDRPNIGRGWTVGPGANTSTVPLPTTSDTMSRTKRAWSAYRQWEVTYVR